MDGINMGIGNAHRENGYMKCGKCQNVTNVGNVKMHKIPKG